MIQGIFTHSLPFDLYCCEYQLEQKSLVQLEQSFECDDTNVTSEENLTNRDFEDENKFWNLDLSE